MDTQREQKINELLKEEVAKRAPAATVAFTLMSTLIFFYHFNTVVFVPGIRFGAVLIFISAFLRFFSARNFLVDREPRSWLGVKLGVWINALGWGIVIALAAFELRGQGLHFAVLITIMTGNLAGSLMTLSSFSYLYLPFLVSCITAAAGVALYQWIYLGIPSLMYLLFAYLVFTLYQLIQFKSVRALQIERLTGQLDLEKSLGELKESQEAFVKQTAKLFHVSKLSALGEMAGGLSHEVNNSLMRIQGAVDQLDRFFQRDGINRTEYFQKIESSREGIRKVKTVIEGLKYFAQEGDEAEKSDHPLQEIVDRTMNFTGELLRAHDIMLFVSPVPNLIVHCNPMQITQVLFYLVKNAYDALEGIDDPDRRWISLSFVEDAATVEIRVTNGGPGLLPDVKSRLFQPFFTTKEVGKGTGLSLSISRGIALAHRGDIYLDEEAAFTTFALKIPSAPVDTAKH